VTAVHAGLAGEDGGTMTMRWRSGSTTSTRNWSPSLEQGVARFGQQIDISVPLKTLQTILQHAAVADEKVVEVAVMKVDCEGCEYSWVPSIPRAQFAAIRKMVGELHFGYIPEERQPSFQAAHDTHRRLCRHANFASQAKECCSVNDHGAYPELCANFAEWLRQPSHRGLLNLDDSRL